MENKEIKIGIGELSIGFPPDKIITIGLGSCIGIAIYDETNRIAGLSHIMLPDSKGFSNQSNMMKFADIAIPKLVNDMIASGANKSKLKSKIAGGASMFNYTDKSSTLEVGKRNAESVKKVLKDLRIPILSEDTGGSSGRTMIIEADTGKVFIRTVGKDIKEL